MAEIGKHVKPIDRAQDETYVASARTVAACLAVSVAIVALICLVQVPKYAMPDDFMQDLYARGAYLDTPGFLMLYSLVGFSAPISWLYALLPAVPWYPVALLSLIAISFAAVGVTVVSARVPAPLKVFLAGALALCEVMATVYLTYTIVAFIACAAGVVLVLRRAPSAGRRGSAPPTSSPSRSSWRASPCARNRVRLPSCCSCPSWCGRSRATATRGRWPSPSAWWRPWGSRTPRV